MRTPTAVAAVRGTEFGVDVAGEETHVGVFDEGKVEVSGQSGETQTLQPNQETSVQRGRGPAKPYALKRLLRQRRRFAAFRRRALAMRRRWRRLAPARRRALRQRQLSRMRQRRQKLMKARARMEKRRQERRQGAP